MATVQSMLRRVQRLEQARAAPRSPIESDYGSMAAFEADTITLMQAGKLDSTDMPVILTCLRRWHADKVWGGFKYRHDGSAEFAAR